MDELGGHYAMWKWNKSNRERQILYDITYMWNLKYTTNWWIKQKKKQTKRYREHTGGYQLAKGSGEGQYEGRELRGKNYEV